MKTDTASATLPPPKRKNGTKSGSNGSNGATDLDLKKLVNALTAFKRGNFSARLPDDWTGVAGKVADTFNEVIATNQRLAEELERVSHTVGKKGRIQQRASLGDVTGSWADSIGSVNALITDLGSPTSEMARVIGAVAKGDLSQTMATDVEGQPLEGEFLRTAKTVNTMVDQLGAFASEVTRVAREVGTEGKLGGQAQVKGVAGTWKDLTDSVNLMASNLTGQVRNIAEVTTAVANGDLAKKITVDVKGEFLELKDTINTMVDQLRSFGSEVTRVAREVGTEGSLGGQARVEGVSGTWKDLTDSVNFMASNLTAQVRNVAAVTTAVANGDLSRKITVDVKGEMLELKNTINTMVDKLGAFASEVTRVAKEVGTEGKLGGQARVEGVGGTWKDLTDNVNQLAGNLTVQLRDVSKVATAIANGDLTRKITVEAGGEILQIKDVINSMVDRLSVFAGEVTRVAREVGTEGVLGGQAEVPGVAGTWKGLTDNVNFMAGNLTGQVRNIADVTTAVAKGDLSRKITVDVKGEMLELKNTINTMVDQLGAFASEVTRVAKEVGTEGKLGGQARVEGVGGTWKDLTDNVNQLAGNLTVQLRDVSKVATAIANGDLTRKITVEAGGEILQIKEVINSMVDRLSVFADEVTRVAREVGTEGVLGGQAEVGGVAGTWKDLTDNVNSMAGNLTGQVRNIALVTTAVANGDLSQKITVNVRGEMLELKNTINTMVDKLGAFASEVTRVAKEVGTEGKLGGQARVEGVGGTWKDLTDNVNQLAGNLTVQLRDVSAVATAIANGDLTRKITVEAGGEILQIKDVINSMVDRLSVFAGEVTRVAREVGTEGVLGGQADVPGVAGTWKGLTDNVNFMAGNLTGQVRNIADVTTAVAKGDLSRKITVDVKGEMLELKNTINTMVDQLGAFASEVTRVAKEVGTEGKLGGQARVEGVGGTWKDLTDNVNQLAGNLTVQLRDVSKVATAIANGDMTRKITVEAGGEILQIKEVINSMVDRLSVFADEVTRVAREVGTEGVLGGQAEVGGVAGTWKDLTDNVNFMAGNLTGQVRNIALVTTAVANGDLSQKITAEVKGEMLQLKDTINTMVDKLGVFADEVTRVAKEVGTEGKLGGQAEVPGAAGTWRALTDNVNAMANSLTAQVRAIADVATAVTKGDLTNTITVEARGELDELKRNLNQMIGNLKETTEKNTEQDWLKTNLAKFSRMMQGQKDLESVSRLIMSELTPLMSAHYGAFYTMEQQEGLEPVLKLVASYAYKARKNVSNRFQLGESLVGQSALEKKPILLTGVPDDYIHIASGLGEAPPRNIIVLPTLFEGQVKAVIELGSFDQFSPTHQAFLDQLSESIGIVLNTIQASSLTENLLKQSQSLATELQSRQQELTQTNQELEVKARELAEQNEEVERKNREVEQARQALEGKAQQLALTSKYKSEFLANMSHELRTPLNSLLILADQLGANVEGNLTPKQVQFAKTIHGSGRDLLTLINDILDLSKIESGTVTVDVTEIPFEDLQASMERTFRPVAEQKQLNFQVDLDPALPQAFHTDSQRLEQILKNLLSNAFKFTERGFVNFRVAPAIRGWSADNGSLNRAPSVLSFSVTDSGIGISAEKHAAIFEAFQQADGSTSRRYGGTGLGLAISRELARLLGGEISLESTDGAGSTFTLFLPAAPVAVATDQPTVARISPAPLRVVEPQSTTPPLKIPDPTPFPAPVESFNDDRAKVVPGDKTVLIIEDDRAFAQWMIDVARDKGFKAIATPRGYTALALVTEFKPNAITLDISLPDLDGWKVLDRLKSDLATRHIPVFVISGNAEPENALKHGALEFLTKPIREADLERIFNRAKEMSEARPRSVLVVEDDEAARQSIEQLIGNETAHVALAATGGEGLNAMDSGAYDCVVVDLLLPDMSGFELIEKLRARHPQLPIVVYTGKDLSREEEERLNRVAQTVIVKDVRSPERLFDQTALWLHRDVSRLPEDKRAILQRLHSPDAILAGKKVLIVDDDIRNIFAMTSLLERFKMDVVTAETGKAAIDVLTNTPGVDLVLMDIMLPEMDGYETMRTIRGTYGFDRLPIIALTAKAMKGDREKCIDAGASDYISKPVDTERLLTLLRTWLYR